MYRIPLHVPGHKQVEITVVVVIEEACRLRPSAAGDSGSCGYIGECPVPVVVVQNVVSIIRDIDVGVPIVVVVPYCNSHAVIAVASPGQSGGLGDVGEAAILVLPVEAVPVLGVRSIK